LLSSLLARWPVWLVAISLVWIAATRIGPMHHMADALASGRAEWLIAAAFFQILYYTLYGVLYWSAFRAVEVDSRSLKLIPLVLGSLAVSVAAPGGTAVGATLFINDAVKRGQSPVRAAAGTMLVVIAELSGVALLTLIAIRSLFTQGMLKPYQITCAGILLLIILLLAAIITVGIWRPEVVERLTSLAARITNWFFRLLRRHEPLRPGWSDEVSEEIIASAVALRQRPMDVAMTFAIAFLMFVVDIISMALIFPAFGQAISFGKLLAGFALGMLFWIVSPTPQGIGVVESVMALAYGSFGVPPAKALLIALAFRGMTFWIPMLVGALMVRNLQPVRVAPPRPMRPWTVQTVSIAVFLMGAVNVLSAVTPALQVRYEALSHLMPHTALRRLIISDSHLAASVAGFALILLARGLYRRKRAAWVLTLVALVVSIISHLVKGLDYEEALLATALAGWLFALHPQFYARSDRPSVRQGVIVLGAAVVFTICYGMIGFYMLDEVYPRNYGMGAAFRQTIEMFTNYGGVDLDPVRHPKPPPLPKIPSKLKNLIRLERLRHSENRKYTFGEYFADSIYTVATVTLAYALLMLLRPVLYRGRPTEEEYQRAARIIKRHGRTTLAACALFDDKNYFFTAGGSVVAFTVKGRTGLALGDPIGPRADARSAIFEFRDYCCQNDWRPAFYQTLPDYGYYYTAAGFNVICIGHEAIVRLDDFTILGGANKQIRWSVNHLTKLGYSVELFVPPHSVETMEQLRAVSDDWLSMVRGREKRFSLGWFDDAYIQSTKVMAVRSPDGDLTAFANIQPEFERNEVTVDLMRRRREVEQGTMDALFVRLLEWAKEEGYETFNLGLSPLSGVGEQPTDQAMERGLRYIYENLNQFYKFKGLHTFKGKFHPEWSPRYLVYQGTSSLPHVAFAIISANSGDDFLWSWMR
jgi:phosphatidylglycerol lysyltransferase